MSYILEALKKSQQERSRGQIPDLQSLHQSIAAAAETVSPRWPYWALGVCLLALAFLLGWLRPWVAQEHAAPANSEQVQTPAVVELPAVKAESVTPPQVVEPVREVVAQQPALPVSPAGRISPEVMRAEIPADTVPHINQLPSLLQQSIPHMQFAGHVYSSNPQQRSVIINDHFMSEGDELMSGMTLLQITPDSVIFDYQGQRFRVAVLQDWSFN